MKEKNLGSWEEFEAEVSRLLQERVQRQTEDKVYISEWLFRGLASHKWQLTTTLERYANWPCTVHGYYRLLLATKPQVETLTGTLWDIPSYADYEEKTGEGLLPPDSFPAYDYFVYLRHHGFPSPLLDWTRSPYIAGYFAFRNAEAEASHAAIYAFCEFTQGRKSGSSSVPGIKGLGPYVRGHRRHFQQQSHYTVCTLHRDGKLQYACHEDAFARNDDDQDELWKFNIPVSEREKIIRRLEQYNINAFSLFGSEESLMETLAIREIYLRPPTRRD